MTITKIKSYLFEKLGWGGIIIIIIFAALFVYGQIQKYQLNKNPAFAKGVIVKKVEGSRGSMYWHFIFNVNGERIESSMPYDNKYNIGDTIKVEYQADNPNNNTPVK